MYISETKCTIAPVDTLDYYNYKLSEPLKKAKTSTHWRVWVYLWVLFLGIFSFGELLYSTPGPLSH